MLFPWCGKGFLWCRAQQPSTLLDPDLLPALCDAAAAADPPPRPALPCTWQAGAAGARRPDQLAARAAAIVAGAAPNLLDAGVEDEEALAYLTDSIPSTLT